MVGAHIVYKRELHITMRDLRSMIAWMLTRDYSCGEVKALIELVNADNVPEYYWQYYYFNLTAPVTYPDPNKVRMLRAADTGIERPFGKVTFVKQTLQVWLYRHSTVICTIARNVRTIILSSATVHALC